MEEREKGGGLMATREEDQAMVVMEEQKERGEEEVIKWNQYLPRLPVSVLLVEGDDSTRQIITALLRKCSYRVVAASDGLKAWEILKEKSQSVDLVLTEVELPFMSGFGLLSIIMEHEICKNIPVIMMSSHDSMSMVFKCMLKGASDFLVKPIRKNELRNLWQHVWRRQIVNGGSGSAQGSQDANLPNLEIGDRVISEKTTDQNVNLQKNKELSEQRSDAQSSCTRSDMEAESKHNTIQNNTAELENKLSSSLNLSINHASIQSHEIKTPLDSNSNPNSQITKKEENVQSKMDESSRENNPSGAYAHLELSLRRFEYPNRQLHEREERNNNNKLNHSNSSPFSLYNGRSKPAPATETESPRESMTLVPNLNLASETQLQNGPIRSIPLPVPAGGLPFDQLFNQNKIESSQVLKDPDEEQKDEEILEMSKRVSGESLSSCISVSNGGSLGNFQNTDGFVRVLTPRELALNKFRLKRKERCFEKKVRYQSRKLLAEKRPRVKGQFVRQEQLVQEAGTDDVAK